MRFSLFYNNPNWNCCHEAIPESLHCFILPIGYYTPWHKQQSELFLNKGISVTKINLFEDHYGGQHIVGEIRNDNFFPTQSIILKIRITDADGKTILKDSKGKPIKEVLFRPFLKILFPGESSGFNYSLSPMMGTAVAYEVTFSSAVKVDAERADVWIEHAQIQKSLYGTSFLIGELVNHGIQPAEIEGLGAAILNESGKVLDANAASDMVQYLAPAGDPRNMDRGAFAIPLRGSFGSDFKWEPFLSAVIAPVKPSPPLQISISNPYVDSLGYFHLAGMIENLGSNQLSFPMIGSVQDSEGTVLDATDYYLPVDLPAGSEMPFDLVDWKVINNNLSLQNLISKTQIQIDPSRTINSSRRYWNLFLSNVEEQMNDQWVWTFQGRVNNFWTETFQKIVVIVSIFNSKNELVATNFQRIYPINPLVSLGRNAHFDLEIHLNPNTDPSGYSYRIQAIAETAW